MLTEQAKANLEKQHYKIVGSHSAVKTCGWTKNMIKGKGGCYKLKFYGIQSHRCMQMTSSISCANRCTFCWRDYKAPVSKEWTWNIDEPEFIIKESLNAQKKLLEGFYGDPNLNENIIDKAIDVRHVALSLTGEPIMYPRINELVDQFHKKHISTFLVTNAQYPESIHNLKNVTQLYLSIDAPNKTLLKEIDQPLFSDFWERLLKSLDYAREKEYRTVARLTLIKDINDIDLPGYKYLIEKGDFDFVEIKAYMHVGASQERLLRENMPMHDYVKEFSLKLAEILPEYEYVSDHEPSRVVLLAKKTFNKKTWINFEQFFKDCGY